MRQGLHTRVAIVALALMTLGWPIQTVAARPAEKVEGAEKNAAAKKDELATLINRQRVAHGVQPLAQATELATAADAHSRDMVVHDYLDHAGSDGSTPQQRAEQAGYQVPPNSAWIVVEVISAISDEPRGPLDWWLNESPEVHGKVLLDPRWREIGVGYATGGEYGHYWTVLVGCRPRILPTVDVDGQTYTSHEACGDPTAIRPTLSATQPTTGAGADHKADIDVNWSGIASPSQRDWIGLFRAGDGDDTYRAWTYVSCSWLPLTPRATGWCSMRVPADLAPGPYEVRLYADDGYTLLATSDPLNLVGR